MSLDTKEIDASLSSLRLSTTTSATKGSGSSTSPMASAANLQAKIKKSSSSSSPIADSWEEAASDDDSPVVIPTATHKRVDSVNVPNPPPPTPISPPNGNPFAPPPANSIADTFAGGAAGFSYSATSERRPSGRPGSGRGEEKRQEKTDAVAKRLIAGALGIKAPKKTDEQRAYDRAIREKEMKRRNEEKEAAKRAEEEREKAKAAIWED